MRGPLTGSLTSDKLIEAARDLRRRIWPEEGTGEVVVGFAVAVLVPETACWPLVDLVAVFLGRKGLPPPPFLLRFCFSSAPAIVQDSKLTNILSYRGREKKKREEVRANE